MGGVMFHLLLSWNYSKRLYLSYKFRIEWFEARVKDVDASNLVKSLARGPNKVAKKFSGYVSNGYRFHTKRHDARRKTQNSGVTLESLTPSFASSKDENPKSSTVTYYGVIKEIIELDYYSQFKVVVLKCDWYEFEEDNYGLICVNFNKLQYQDDPFVLASQVHQCFYVQDPFNESKHYAMSKVSKDLLDGKEIENSDIQSFYWNQSNDHTKNFLGLVNDEDVQWIRQDLPETIVDQPIPMVNVDENSDEDSDVFDIDVGCQ